MPNPKHILAVSAHPDDETMFAGGTLAMYAEQGHDVYILETTRGEGGELGDPPLTTRENIGAYREGETRCAARELGAREVFFLPFVDPYMEIGGEARPIDVPLDNFVSAIADYIRELQPDLILTHGSNGEYGHPQHRLTHRATRMAMALFRKPISLATWCAWYEPSEYERLLNQDDLADLVLDISPWLLPKTAAAICHRSQHTMFRRNRQTPRVADIVLRTESWHIWRGEM